MKWEDWCELTLYVFLFSDCLINLHEKDKILLAQEKSKLKSSQKKFRFGKVREICLVPTEWQLQLHRNELDILLTKNAGTSCQLWWD